MPAHQFNLVDEPWVPCVATDGSRKELGLLETLTQAHQIREVYDPSPLVTSALHKLLLAVLHRNFGPADVEDWGLLWRRGSFDEVVLESYFDDWRHRFNLFDEERPFYQAMSFNGKSKVVAVNDLIPELTRGRNPTLFDHTMNEDCPPIGLGTAARSLVAIQNHRLGGLSGLDRNFKDAPAAREVSFLMFGDTLFETLMLNMVAYSSEYPIAGSPLDAPAWEQTPSFESGVPEGYLDLLTWQTIAVRLVRTGGADRFVSQVELGLGRDYGASELNHPLSFYRKDRRGGWRGFRFREGVTLWRDMSSLLALRANGGDVVLPSPITWVAQIVDQNSDVPDEKLCALMTYGMESKQAKINLWRRERMPLPLRYLTDDGIVAELGYALELAEKIAQNLNHAIVRVASEIATGKDRAKVRDHLDPRGNYWAVLENPFFVVVTDILKDVEAAQNSWVSVLRRAALDAFDSGVSGLENSVRGMRAVAYGRRILIYDLRKTLADK